MKCEGLEIVIRRCIEDPNYFCMEVRTPEEFYKFGDYATRAEAQKCAQAVLESRRIWHETSGRDYWRPNVWQSRTGPRGGIEFWRRGPRGSTLSVWQPHGVDSYWRIYWDMSPIVRTHNDPGIFDTPMEAIGVLENLAADGMATILLD